MKKIILIALIVTLASASINVDTTYSTAGAIVKKIGKEYVKVIVLGSAKYDPHFIVPKPSLLAKLRRADLLVINGAGLELGWLPPLLRSANNAKIQNGASGFLDISHYVHMIDVPTSVSRAFGDVHSQGNPHYSTDPYVVLDIAKAIKDKLIEIDSTHEITYEQNYENFVKEWDKYLQNFDAKMARCNVEKVVQYHELFNYFLKRYEIKSYANIEPLAGIAPSAKHTIELIKILKEKNIKTILQDVYHERKTARFIASKTDAKVVILPHDVKKGTSLEDFYNEIAQKICK